MSTTPESFDLDAAWVRRAQGDLKGFMGALATRFESALPGRVTVDRRRDGLLSRSSHVRAISIDGDGARFDLVFDRGKLRATRSKLVRGVVIGNTELTVEQWLSEIRLQVETLSGSLSGARDVLKDFL